MSRKIINSHNNSRKDIKHEVDRLIAKGVTRVDMQKLRELQKDYPNDTALVETIVETLSARVETVRAKAKRMAEAILLKVGDNVPLHTLLRKALALRERMDLSDTEFEFFKNELYAILQGRTDSKTQYEQGTELITTNLSRVFGEDRRVLELNVDRQDMPHLQKIVNAYTLTKATHANVVIQSMLYTNLANRAVLAKYDSNVMHMDCYIDPVLVAMFAPKFRVFEETFLFANIAFIIKCKHERRQLLTGPDEILMRNMINDPTDIVCDSESPMKDLVRRVELQTALWQNVFALRTGRYYDPVSKMFSAAVDSCRISTVDSPDTMAIGDDATTMRRLLQAFSLRPTTVSTSPLNSIIANNGIYNLPILADRITTTPMITVRIKTDNVTEETQELDLEEAVSQPSFFNENGMMVPKTQKIVYTRDVLIFNIPRRTSYPVSNVQIQTNFANVPPVLNIFERINTYPVRAQPEFTIASSKTTTNTLVLRSAVIVNVNQNIPDMPLGSAAILFRSGYGAATSLKYDPYVAGITHDASIEPSRNEYATGPMRRIENSSNDDTGINYSYGLATRYATLLIYGRQPEDDVMQFNGNRYIE